MKISEIRELATVDLHRELEQSRREMMNLRFRHATHQLDNDRQLGKTRQSIARLLTVLRERELASAVGDGNEDQP